MANKEELDDCLGLGARETDYKLTEGLLDALPELYQQDEVIYEYSQGLTKSCTVYSAIGAISDLFNIEIPKSTVEKWDNDTYSNGRKEGQGWFVALAVEHIKNEWNNSEYAKKYGKVAFYSIDLRDDDLVQKILLKRYTICTGYDGNAKYNNDRNDNGILDGTEFGVSTYGHAVNAIRPTSGTISARIKDNYKGRKNTKGLPTNIYGVAHKFSEIPCFFDRGFIYTKVAEDALEEVKRLNEFRSNLINAIELNSKMRHQTNDTNYQGILHYMNEKNRKKLQDCDNELKKYI